MESPKIFNLFKTLCSGLEPFHFCGSYQFLVEKTSATILLILTSAS